MTFALLLKMCSQFFWIFHLKKLNIIFSMYKLLKSLIYLLIFEGLVVLQMLRKSDLLEILSISYFNLVIFFLIIHIETQLLGSYTSVMAISSWWIGLLIISKVFPFVFGNDFCFEGYFFWFSLMFTGNIFVQWFFFFFLLSICLWFLNLRCYFITKLICVILVYPLCQSLTFIGNASFIHILCHYSSGLI